MCENVSRDTIALSQQGEFLMKRFVEGEDRSQSTLFPERLDDYIAEDNPVRVIDAFIDAGINCMHPMEPAANMDIVQIRQKYGNRLAFYGGLE